MPAPPSNRPLCQFVHATHHVTAERVKYMPFCVSVFSVFFKQPILRAILLSLIAILTQQLLQRILHTCGNNFTFSRLKLYLRQSSSFNDSRAFCCQDEGKIIQRQDFGLLLGNVPSKRIKKRSRAALHSFLHKWIPRRSSERHGMSNI